MGGRRTRGWARPGIWLTLVFPSGVNESIKYYISFCSEFYSQFSWQLRNIQFLQISKIILFSCFQEFLSHFQLHLCDLAVIQSSITSARSLTTAQSLISQMKNDIVGQTVILPQIPINFMETFSSKELTGHVWTSAFLRVYCVKNLSHNCAFHVNLLCPNYNA